ncbi:hypothetical protein D3C76_899390 [compost metagenome]
MLRQPGAACRGADLRRRPGQGGRPRRARLLGAAAQPESSGGNPGTEPAASHPREVARGGGHPRRVGQLPQRRHRGIHLRRRPRCLLLPRSEHPPAGRTPGHRDGHRPRPDRMHAARGRRRRAGLAGLEPRAAGRLHRSAHLCGGPAEELPAQPRRAHRSAFPGMRAGGRLGRQRHRGVVAL